MTVIQTNQWTCDICGATAETGEVTGAWSDPVVNPPKGWDAMLTVPASVRTNPSEDCCDACPACIANPDWAKYVAHRDAPKWPDHVINRLGRMPRVGDWWAPCCLEDLERLNTQEDVDSLLQSAEETGINGPWPSLDAALAWAVPDLQKSGQHTQAEIDAIVALRRAEEARALGTGPNIPDVAPVFRAYRDQNPAWGSLHTVLDDGNITDENVKFCITDARDHQDVVGFFLGKILLLMSKTQRSALPGKLRTVDAASKEERT